MHTITTWKRVLLVALGGILTASVLAATAQTLEPRDTMSLDAYASQRAFQGDEDIDGWDCRINGNQTCADGRYVARVTRTGVVLTLAP